MEILKAAITDRGSRELNSFVSKILNLHCVLLWNFVSVASETGFLLSCFNRNIQTPLAGNSLSKILNIDMPLANTFYHRKSTLIEPSVFSYYFVSLTEYLFTVTQQSVAK